MQYYVGQPVLSNMTEGNTYVQDSGPDMGKPVERGIVTQVLDPAYSDQMIVWWENCRHGYTCDVEEIRPAQEPPIRVGMFVTARPSVGYIREDMDGDVPVERGIVTHVFTDGDVDIHWEGCRRSRITPREAFDIG